MPDKFSISSDDYDRISFRGETIAFEDRPTGGFFVRTSLPQGMTAESELRSKYELYTICVQDPICNVLHLRALYRALSTNRVAGNEALHLREDFSGAGHTAATWVSLFDLGTAMLVDVDGAVLDEFKMHVRPSLSPGAANRTKIFQADVRNVPPLNPMTGECFDIVCAMNSSYWALKTRPAMLEYFKSVRASLNESGLFVLDAAYGWELMQDMRANPKKGTEWRCIQTTKEDEDCPGWAFRYAYEVCRYNPITSDSLTRIHFDFQDGSELRNAFEYRWRLWSPAETSELLIEAGFRPVFVYQGEGLETLADMDPEPLFHAYIVGIPF